MLPEGEFHVLRDPCRQGLSISEIALETGYNRSTVSKYVKAKVPLIGLRLRNIQQIFEFDIYKKVKGLDRCFLGTDCSDDMAL
jgi:transcriptional regulator with XRE-family HTH domain